MKICKTTKLKVFQFHETTQNTFLYFCIFFSFIKQSKLSEKVTCFVHFRILRNKKNKKLSTLVSGALTGSCIVACREGEKYVA